MIIEYICQTLLAHCEDYPGFYKKHAGKLCRIQLDHCAQTFVIHQSGISFCNIDTETIIQCKMDDILEALTMKKNIALQFSGDVALCQDLGKLLLKGNIHHESLLFSYLPDTIALAIIELIKNLKPMYHFSQSQLCLFIQDYLTDETGIAATQAECNTLYEETQRLKWAAEALSSE